MHRLERVPPALAPHLPARHGAQLLVDQRNQPFERRLIALAQGHEQLGHLQARGCGLV